ncbi:MAG: hypothetical protein B6D56_01425 [Candidatus Omnitrophica bacterium 4484_70.1]|nr:MAG: hypothetical protein B6D56_01425 [Candidatus Omnitrophica bacterium 4484_70.1]
MRRLVVGNALTLTISEIISKVLEFASILIIARILDVEKFGIFAFAGAVGMFFSLIPHFGFDYLVTRDISRWPRKTGKYFLSISLAKIILVLVALLMLSGWLEFFSGFSREKKTLVYLASTGVFFMTNVFFVTSFFRAHQKAKIEAGLRLFLAFLVSTVSIIVALLSRNLFFILTARLLVCASVFILGIMFFRKKLKPAFKTGLTDVFYCIKRSYPFAVFIFLVTAYMSIDTVMLNLIKGDIATGLYNVAARITMVFLLIPTGVCNAVLPALSSERNSNTQEFHSILGLTFRFLSVIACIIILLSIIFGRKVVSFTFSNNYLVSGQIFSVLCWVILPAYINHLLGTVLLAIDKEKLLVYFSLLAAVVNISLNAVLIPRYSYYGAALATIVTELLVVIMQVFYLYRKVFNASNLKKNLLPALIGIGFIIITSILPEGFSLLGGIFCGLFYIFLLYKLGSFSSECSVLAALPVVKKLYAEKNS